jgi:hypothetical protein
MNNKIIMAPLWGLNGLMNNKNNYGTPLGFEWIDE